MGLSDEHRRSGKPANIRWREPQDQANAINFLLSDDAGFITGAELIVDGGVLAAYPKQV